MPARTIDPVDQACAAAFDVLLNNLHGPYYGLPRTAGWGYPEPYTRDLAIAALGMLATEDERMVRMVGRVLQTLAKNQTPRGHIPSLVHDPGNRGASDTTPLFLLALGAYRNAVGEPHFLDQAAARAMEWMSYQSPDDALMVTQMPTTDWRDEHWVLGYGLYVNAIVYGYLKLFARHDEAARLRDLMSRFTITGEVMHRHVHEGLVVRHTPYYAFWSFKLYSSERFDLLGNALAVLLGVAPRTRADAIVTWTEAECDAMRDRGDLAVDLPPNFFPYVYPSDPDWRPRYEKFNNPGDYHNGGVWPFICGFYVAACVAAGKTRTAARNLEALTRLVRPARDHDVKWGFNEWFRATDGTPRGQDWQTWSAAMYLYAAACVRTGRTPHLDGCREEPPADREP